MTPAMNARLICRTGPTIILDLQLIEEEENPFPVSF